MPKEEPHLAPLRKKRLERRLLLDQKVPAIIYFQVIGQGTPGGPRSLFLYTDAGRFMFNCGEGTQRLCTEYCGGRTLAELSHIFITRRSWENLGGLPGMYLSIRSAGSPDVTIHGPPGTIDIYHGLRNFMAAIDFDVIKHEGMDNPYDTKAFTIHHVDLTPTKDKAYPPQLKHSDWSPVRSQAYLNSGLKVSETKPSIKVHSYDMTQSYDETVTAYIMKCKARPGMLLVQTCIDLGVPPGPLMGELKAGRNVILDDGTCVKSEDVVEQELDPQTYVVIEIPTMHHMTSLENEEKLQPKSLDHIRAIFHFSPPEVMKSERYVAWMNSFSMRVQHIVINGNQRGYHSNDVLSYNKKLHMMNPAIFRGLAKDCLVEFVESELAGIVKAPVHQGKVDQKFHVRPSDNVTEDNVLVDLEQVEKDVMNLPNVPEMIAKVQNEIANDKDAEAYPKTTILGTGSAVPSKYRNVSSILIETRPDNYIILDSGEGTVLQLHRKFGREKSMEIMRNLKAIYISHMHADHHLGFINLIQCREKAFGETEPPKLYIMAPSRMSEYLLMYHCKFEPILQNLHQIKLEHLLKKVYGHSTEPTQSIYSNVLEDLKMYCGFDDVVTCKALHCPSSFCVAITLSGGYKIVYSGDTRPTDELINLGLENKRTNLLIHEATVEHYMLADCKMKKHSTFTEAIEDGKKMNAEFTLLTHFSQRYAKVPILDEIVGNDNIGIAWDFMTVNPKTYHLISKSYDLFKHVFAEDYELMLTRKDEYYYRNPHLGIEPRSIPTFERIRKRKAVDYDL